MCLIASLAVLLAGNAAEAAPKAKKKGAVRGTVVEVKKDADKESGTLIIKVIPKKNKKAPADAAPKEETRTFKVTTETKVEQMVGKKKDAKPEPSKFSSIEKDAVVSIKADGDTAQEIQIAAKKKKKKAQ
jgi:hypothetical protein